MINYIFELSTTKVDKRPKFDIKMSGKILSCLYDSGAVLPVINKVTYNYLGLSDRNKIAQTRLSGFGGSGENVGIYLVKQMMITDSKGQRLFLYNMPVVLSNANKEIDVILAAPIFYHMHVIISLANDILICRSERNNYTYRYSKDSISVMCQIP